MRAIREFVGSTTKDGYDEINILVETHDYKDFKIIVGGGKNPIKTYKFISEDIDGYINSEKKISDFIGLETGLFNVYSLNDFQKIEDN